MNALVIIPTILVNNGFSAPIAWLFAGQKNRVRGMYGYELTRDAVREYDTFIIELNWFIELIEFGKIVEFIRAHNKKARILFGGLYAAVVYKQIFERYNIDYFILGDNEVPIQLFLEGTDPKEIPNFVGRDFENRISYRFRERDYFDLEFDLAWFPSWDKYRDKEEMFQQPHIVTSKGGCDNVHEGCEYCMGSKRERLRQIYGRPPISMSSDALMSILRKIEQKFTQASMYVTRSDNYSFSDVYFDLDVTIELDARVSYEQVKNIRNAFKKVLMFVPIYEEGMTGRTMKKNYYQEIMSLEDEQHKIMFYCFGKDASQSGIPKDHILFAELTSPKFAEWTFYTNIDVATEASQKFYDQCKRHFVDGTPTLDQKNPDFTTAMVAFALGY